MKTYLWPDEPRAVRMQRIAIGILIIHTLQISKAIFGADPLSRTVCHYTSGGLTPPFVLCG